MSGQLNVNQFALPGMEQHAHAGAKALSMGYQFEYNKPGARYPGSPHQLEMRDTVGVDKGRQTSSLDWATSTYRKPGEINMVRTDPTYQGMGMASTLYNLGHDPKVFTGNDTLPLHSTARTRDGFAWSAKVGGWDPYTDLPKDRPEHPYEARKRQQVSAGVIPKMPGQLQLPGTGE